MIEKTIEITRKDIFRLRLEASNQTRYFLYALASGIFFAISLIINFIFKGNLSDRFVFYTSIALIIVLPLYLFLQYYYAGRIKKETVAFQHPFTYQISESMFHSKGYKIETSIDWNDFYNCIESKNAFYLLISSMQAYIVPKRHFLEDELSEIRRIITPFSKKKPSIFIRIIAFIISAIFIISALTNIITLFT